MVANEKTEERQPLTAVVGEKTDVALDNQSESRCTFWKHEFGDQKKFAEDGTKIRAKTKATSIARET